MIVARLLAPLLVPLGALLAVHLAIPRLAHVPASLTGLKVYAPHIAILLGLALSVGFGRTRSFFALILLAVAYAGIRAYPEAALYHLITVALPLNLAVIAWRRDRSLASPQSLQLGAVFATEAALLAAWGSKFPESVEAALGKAYFGWLAAGALGEPALIATAIGVVVAGGAWIARREAAALALVTTIVAFALAARAVDHHPDAASLFVATAGVVLAVAVLQDLFHMAFRDPLTGLMSRRALEDDLATLGRRYAIAMVDIDHFKRVNDTYGHDTGDQVLKMVAHRLARVRRGARAYRYGGEEFALLFPGRDTRAVWEQLEALREDIAAYPFRLRATGREKAGRHGRKRKPAAGRELKVTVSIGVAQASARDADPHATIASADNALYRAKRRGRNAVCR
jgi:diguanylate cyclase (GGDEF)-like protein